jgi:hypothetical protein
VLKEYWFDWKIYQPASTVYRAPSEPAATEEKPSVAPSPEATGS